jgi:hypothetical protein
VEEANLERAEAALADHLGGDPVQQCETLS